ncbi:MAG: hypothetical protein ACYDCX_04910 [Acidithiobacillus sp.]
MDEPGPAMDTQIDDLVIALLQQLCAEEPLSLARANKALGIRRSQMDRLLLLLGHSEILGGLGYIYREEQGGRPVIRLTDKGRALCA